MKKYIKPLVNCIEIRLEERLMTSCVKGGSCWDTIANNCTPNWTEETWSGFSA